ncbi:hypothetical protein F4703DRAFT_1827163, partial [Phycomyces blakesleeanus]
MIRTWKRPQLLWILWLSSVSWFVSIFLLYKNLLEFKSAPLILYETRYRAKNLCAHTHTYIYIYIWFYFM